MKYADDFSDARWLAEMRRLRTALVLGCQNLVARNTGERLSGNAVKALDWETVERYLPEPNLGMAVRANVAVIERLTDQIACR